MKLPITIQKCFSLFGVQQEKPEAFLQSLTGNQVSYTMREQHGELTLKLTAFANHPQEAERILTEREEQVRKAYAPWIYADEDITLQQAVVRELTAQKRRIATAESLTGGLVSKRLTEVSGASAVLECGVCSYSNRIKHELLGVRAQTLNTYTEYSPQTALEMAEGVRRLSGAEIGVSTTGIAGPGGVDGKPAGLVYVAVSTENDSIAYELQLSQGEKNNREQVRSLAASHALFAVWEVLCGRADNETSVVNRTRA